MNYFKDKEFACRCCGRLLICSELIEKLNAARSQAGIPFIITSGYRCNKHNENIAGVAESSHTRGKAVDILFKNSQECFSIVKSLIYVGFKRIGINFNKRFIHCDIDESKPQNVLFDY